MILLNSNSWGSSLLPSLYTAAHFFMHYLYYSLPCLFDIVLLHFTVSSVDSQINRICLTRNQSLKVVIVHYLCLFIYLEKYFLKSIDLPLTKIEATGIFVTRPYRQKCNLSASWPVVFFQPINRTFMTMFLLILQYFY